ncbi:S1 family peptidase [Veronia nyctiphanis]|uniref:S1 family peptidase n=1 Tax=Veronia nyctiphanis TaxID=1278244 RepID=UPI00100B1F91|nr:serine protease [Veronia nyctiphanis]
MQSKKFVLLSIYLLLSASLQGCFLTNGPTQFADEKTAPDLNYLPIGIPFVLGGFGSSVPLTEELSLTAKHVAQYDFSEVVAYHPNCDVAIIKADNSDKKLPLLGKVFPNDNLNVYGFGMTGKVITGKGKYFLDVNFLDSAIFKKCPASITDAPIQSGMSGGGVYNEKGHLVGIISGMSGSGFKVLGQQDLGNKRTSVFISSLFIKGWLQYTVDKYHGKKIALFADDNASGALVISRP